MLLEGTDLIPRLSENTELFRKRMNDAGFTVLVRETSNYFFDFFNHHGCYINTIAREIHLLFDTCGSHRLLTFVYWTTRLFENLTIEKKLSFFSAHFGSLAPLTSLLWTSIPENHLHRPFCLIERAPWSRGCFLSILLDKWKIPYGIFF